VKEVGSGRSGSVQPAAPVSVTLASAVSRAHPAEPADLLAAAQRGDASAQAELFGRHHVRVARQILRMTGDADGVDDLLQEVFIAAFAALSGFRRDAQLETWLYTIATNKVRNWWDARRRRDLRESHAAMIPRDEVRTPEDELVFAEHLAGFYRALGELPDKLREAFTARAIEHLSLQEASAVLGVPISTVSYRTRRAEQLICAALGLSAVSPHDPANEPEDRA
jgi:RNA polymerase sigma-70 factor, ECF subfamily